MSNTIRAKFVVHSKKETLHGQEQNKLTTIEMAPVSCQHEQVDGKWEIIKSENTKFWQASPSGRLELGCINQEAADAFELGKEYYIDFIKAN